MASKPFQIVGLTVLLLGNHRLTLTLISWYLVSLFIFLLSTNSPLHNDEIDFRKLCNIKGIHYIPLFES